MKSMKRKFSVILAVAMILSLVIATPAMANAAGDTQLVLASGEPQFVEGTAEADLVYNMEVFLFGEFRSVTGPAAVEFATTKDGVPFDLVVGYARDPLPSTATVAEATLNELEPGTYVVTADSQANPSFTITVTPAGPPPPPPCASCGERPCVCPFVSVPVVGVSFAGANDAEREATRQAGAGMVGTPPGPSDPWPADANDAAYEGVFINLTAETLSVEGFDVAGFRTRDRGNFTAGTPDARQVARIINSGGTLQLADHLGGRNNRQEVAGRAYVAPQPATRSTDAQGEDVYRDHESDTDADGDPIQVPVYNDDAVTEVLAQRGTRILTLGTIARRDRTERLTVNFAIRPDPSGVTNGNWTLAARGFDGNFANDEAENAWMTLMDTFEIADVPDRGVLPTWASNRPEEDADSNPLPDGGNFVEGFGILPLDANGRVQRTRYLVRQAPQAPADPAAANATWAPGTRPARVTVSSVLRTPNVRPDYRNELLRLRAPMTMFFGEPAMRKEIPVIEPGEGIGDDDVTVITQAGTDPFVAAAGKYLIINDRDAARRQASFTAYLEQDSVPVTVWASATDRRPASAPLVVMLAARGATPQAAGIGENAEANAILWAPWASQTVQGTNGRARLARGFQAFNPERGRWAGLPRITASTPANAPIRLTRAPNARQARPAAGTDQSAAGGFDLRGYMVAAVESGAARSQTSFAAFTFDARINPNPMPDPTPSPLPRARAGIVGIAFVNYDGTPIL